MLTLGTQRDLTNDMLIKGIIDSVVTVNQFYGMLPFKGIQGNALAYNRELAGVDQSTLVDTLRTGVVGINKAQQQFSRHSTELTTIIGDAQVNGLIQAVGSDFNDATAVQVAAKAKGLGRTYMNLLVNGSIDGVNSGVSLPGDFVSIIIEAGAIDVATGLLLDAGDVNTAAKRNAIDVTLRGFGATSAPEVYSNLTTGTTTETLAQPGADAYNHAHNLVNGFDGFDGLDTFVTNSGRSAVTTGNTTGAATLAALDLLIDSVHDKDGMVDFMMMNSAGVRKITAAFRSVGTGFDMMDVKTSSGSVMSVQSYRGVPIFRNDFIGNTGLANLSGGDLGDLSSTATAIYVGTLDDGSLSHGICGLTAIKSAGLQVQKLGAREDADADITRVKWYCGLAHFSELGLVKGQI